MKNINWNNLKFFLAVGQTGSLSAAATLLDSNPATVGRHIAQLELELGITLFVKHARGYSLTENGQTLMSQMGTVGQAISGLEENELNDSLHGEIKLAVPESVAHYLLLPKLRQFQYLYPQLRIEMLVSRHTADLARREADIAVRIIEPHQRDFSADYIAKQVGEFHFALYIHESLKKQQSNWVALPHVSWDTTWIKLPMVEWLKVLFPSSKPVLRSNSMQAHVAAAKGGEVVVMLPQYIGRAEPDLVEINYPMPHTRHELWLFYHRDLRGNQKVQALHSFIAASFSESLINYTE